MISIRGQKQRLWRAVDANGDVLEVLVQSRRNAHTAKRFLTKLIRRWALPRVVVTNKLRGYGVAVRDLCPSVDHRSHKGLITVPRRRIDTHDEERRSWAVSNHHVRLSSFYPSTTRLPPSFGQSVTAFPQDLTATPGLTLSACGSTMSLK